jgi:general stress protein CsbA
MRDPNKPEISWRKVVTFLIAVPLAAVFAWHAQKGYHENPDAILVVVTVFSILAGFLVAILALIADERSLRGRTWRHDKIYFQMIKRDLRLHRNMFYLYLVVLSFAFVASLKLTKTGMDPCIAEEIERWLELIVLFLGALAMVWSFSLPGRLMRRHIDALNAQIKARQEAETGQTANDGHA